MRLEDDSISEHECAFSDESAAGASAPQGGAGAGAWLWWPPALARPLALLAGAALFVLLALGSPAVASGLEQLARRHPWPIALPGALMGLVALLAARASERWRGEAVDRLVLRLPASIGVIACLLSPFAAAPWLLLVGYALVLGALLLRWRGLWSRRAERAWLLHKPGYGSGLVGIVAALVALPALAALGLRLGAQHLHARADHVAQVWRQATPECLMRVQRASAGAPLDRLALVTFGARLGGQPGRELASCLAPELSQAQTLAQQLKLDSERLCAPEAEGHNVAVFQQWFERRARLIGARWLVEALDADAQRDYGDALKAQADAGAACGDPFLLPEALLLDAADARGALGGCAGRLATAALDDWRREAVGRWRKAALPQGFTDPAFPLTGRAHFATAREKVGPGGVYVQTKLMESIALRPRPDGKTFEVAADLRWLPEAHRDLLNPRLKQVGNELYVVACGDADAARTLDSLRDQWDFANRQVMGSGECPISFGKATHHVLPFPGGQAFVVAQYQRVTSGAQVRLGFTRANPCAGEP